MPSKLRHLRLDVLQSKKQKTFSETDECVKVSLYTWLLFVYYTACSYGVLQIISFLSCFSSGLPGWQFVIVFKLRVDFSPAISTIDFDNLL